MPFENPYAKSYSRIKNWMLTFTYTWDDFNNENGTFNAKVTGTIELGARGQYEWVGKTNASYTSTDTINVRNERIVRRGTAAVNAQARILEDKLEVTLHVPAVSENVDANNTNVTATVTQPIPSEPIPLNLRRDFDYVVVEDIVSGKCSVEAELRPGEFRHYYPIEVRLRTFIPSPLISLEPATEGGSALLADLLGGDGRDFSYDGGTYRSFVSVVVTLDPSTPKDFVFGPTRMFGRTRVYDANAGMRATGKPWWWWVLRNPQTRPKHEDMAPVTDENLSVRLMDRHESAVFLKFQVSQAIPQVTMATLVAPAIDAEFDIQLYQNQDDTVSAAVEGQHDGFPAYELYGNGVPIYRFSPVTRNTGPTHLAPPMDTTVQLDELVAVPER